MPYLRVGRQKVPFNPMGARRIGVYDLPMPPINWGDNDDLKNNIWAQPFPVVIPTTYDTIAFWLSALEAGTSARLGIYDDVNGVPTNLLVDAGTVATVATGWKAVAIAASLSIGEPSLIYLAILTDWTGTARIAANDAYSQQWYRVGGADGKNILGCCSAAQAYGALPAVFPAPTWSAPMLAMGLKIKSIP